MLLDRIEVVKNQSGTLVLPLRDPTDGILIEGIDGLDPVQASIVSSQFAQIDGEQFQSSRREKRNIVIKLGLDPAYGGGDVGAIRSRLYGFFMPKTKITMSFFMDDGSPVDIVGWVESFTSPKFTEDPSGTISILCLNPDFYTPTKSIVAWHTSPDTAAILFNYDGTVDTGIIFTLNLDRALSEFTIYHTPSDGIMRTHKFVAPLLADDVLQISTVSGDKWANLTRLGITSSILYGVSPDANWISLLPGDNTILVVAEGAEIPFTIEYNDKFGGL